jgi:hypothetical protein
VLEPSFVEIGHMLQPPGGRGPSRKGFVKGAYEEIETKPQGAKGIFPPPKPITNALVVTKNSPSHMVEAKIRKLLESGMPSDRSLQIDRRMAYVKKQIKINSLSDRSVEIDFSNIIKLVESIVNIRLPEKNFYVIVNTLTKRVAHAPSPGREGVPTLREETKMTKSPPDDVTVSIAPMNLEEIQEPALGIESDADWISIARSETVNVGTTDPREPEALGLMFDGFDFASKPTDPDFDPKFSDIFKRKVLEMSPDDAKRISDDILNAVKERLNNASGEAR